MSTSTAQHDLVGIKHALELGLILAALVLAASAYAVARLTPIHSLNLLSLIDWIRGVTSLIV
jgi:hypothetical protein